MSLGMFETQASLAGAGVLETGVSELSIFEAGVSELGVHETGVSELGVLEAGLLLAVVKAHRFHLA